MYKLTLEILSAYLPWGLESINNYQGVLLRKEITSSNIMTFVWGETSFKPLLHPLSIQFLTSIIHHADDMEEVLTAIEDDTLLQIRHDLFTEIVKHHGDVYGLIPLGLAVDKRMDGE